MPNEPQDTPPVVDEGLQQEPVVETPETVDEVEERARSQGWVPKEEWKGDPAAWRPAAVFVDRGELLTKIKSQSTEMRELRAMLSELSEQNRKLYEAGYQKAIKELEAMRDAAIEAQDMQAVRAIDQDIRAHERALEATTSKPKVAATSAASAEANYKEFLSRNRWYEEDERLQDWANGRAVKYRTQHPNASDIDVYEHLEEQVRIQHPDKFKRVGAPSPDGKGDRGGASPPKTRGGDEFERLLSQLPEDQAAIARNFVKRGVMTKEKYIQDLKAIGGWQE